MRKWIPFLWMMAMALNVTETPATFTEQKKRVYEISMEQAILERIRYAATHPNSQPATAQADADSQAEDPLMTVHRDYDDEVQKIFESLY